MNLWMQNPPVTTLKPSWMMHDPKMTWRPRPPVSRMHDLRVRQEGILTASEALQKIQPRRRRKRPRPVQVVAQETKAKPDEDKPQVVFFPTSGDQDSEAAATCQDHDAQGSGFNAFAFLSFLLSVFNAVR